MWVARPWLALAVAGLMTAAHGHVDAAPVASPAPSRAALQGDDRGGGAGPARSRTAQGGHSVFLPINVLAGRVPSGGVLEPAGRVGGAASGVVALGTDVFVARGRALQRLDVSNPSAPVDRGLSQALSGLVMPLGVVSGTLYVKVEGRDADALAGFPLTEPIEQWGWGAISFLASSRSQPAASRTW
jgi:hypothetical protein